MDIGSGSIVDSGAGVGRGYGAFTYGTPDGSDGPSEREYRPRGELHYGAEAELQALH